MLRAILVFAVAAVPLFSLGAASATGELSSLTQEMHQARVRSDWQSFGRYAQVLSNFLNGSPDAAIEVARAKVHMGDRAGALNELKNVADLGESVPMMATLPDFAPLRSAPEFKRILAQMARNAKPQSIAHRVITLDDPNLLPEDIDYDSATRSFFLTSVLEDKIVRVSEDGRTRTFARSLNGWPMQALKIDERRHLVWATEVAIDGFKAVPKRDWGRSALVAYDFNGRLVQSMEPRNPTQLGDMALLSDGNVVVSDGEHGGVYATTTNGPLTRVDSGDFISPQTPAYVSPDTVLVPDYVRGIAVLNLRTKAVRWIAMDRTCALEGIDGAYLVGRNLFVTQNGTTPERVSLLVFDPNLQRLESSTIIERATPNLDPTHGVWVHGKFFYIANSGWDSIDDAGTMKPGAHRTPAYIMEYDEARI